jgi:hypothetical protein
VEPAGFEPTNTRLRRAVLPTRFSQQAFTGVLEATGRELNYYSLIVLLVKREDGRTRTYIWRVGLFTISSHSLAEPFSVLSSKAFNFFRSRVRTLHTMQTCKRCFHLSASSQRIPSVLTNSSASEFSSGPPRLPIPSYSTWLNGKRTGNVFPYLFSWRIGESNP